MIKFLYILSLSFFYLLCPFMAFSQRANFEYAIGQEESNEYALKWVHNVKILNGKLAILDNQRVIITDTSGSVICKFGGYSSKVDNTSMLTDIALDEKGNYIVATWGALKLFSSKGYFIKQIILKGIPAKGLGMNITQINHREKKWYIFDQANRNIKIFDDQFNFINIIGNISNDKYEGASRSNLDKYPAEALIEPNGFYFSNNNISITDIQGYIKNFDNSGKFLDYKIIDKVSYWIPAAQEHDNQVLVAHPERKEVYTYKNNEIYPIEQLNKTIKENSLFSLHNITSLCTDAYNYYITFHFRDYKIAIVSKDKYKLKKIISVKANPNKIWINKPTHLNIRNGTLFVQEDNSSVKRIDCVSKPTNAKQAQVSGGNFDFTLDNKILLAARHDNKLLLYDTTGKLIKTWSKDIDFSAPYFVKNIKSNTIIIDRYNKYSRVYHFSNDGNLIKLITKNNYNKDFNSYSAAIDNDNNLYISEDGSIHVYDSFGKYVKTLGGFAIPIRQDLNLGLGVTKSGRDLKLNLGDYQPKPLHFETIHRTEIYKKHLFIADYYKLVITDLQGNIKGYIGGEKGTNLDEFNMISDFCIWNDRIFIADHSNNRIIVYKISI